MTTPSISLVPWHQEFYAHTYTYNGSNNLLTDTCTDGVYTWVKTYTYTGALLTSESAWVQQ